LINSWGITSAKGNCIGEKIDYLCTAADCNAIAIWVCKKRKFELMGMADVRIVWVRVCELFSVCSPPAIS